MGYEELINAVFNKETSVKILDINSARVVVSGLISELTEREQKIIELRFGLLDGKIKTLQQIGDIFGVCRERIRQLERKALRKLKHRSRRKQLEEILLKCPKKTDS